MNKKYEVYINGSLATKHLTFAGAEKTLARFPDANGQIFKIIPGAPTMVLLKDQRVK